MYQRWGRHLVKSGKPVVMGPAFRGKIARRQRITK
jgi:hypothetical protein